MKTLKTGDCLVIQRL